MARYIDADKLTDKLEELQFNAPAEIRQVAVRTAFDGKNGLLAEGVELLNELLRTGARVVLVNPYYDAKGRVIGNEYIVEIKKRS